MKFKISYELCHSTTAELEIEHEDDLVSEENLVIVNEIALKDSIRFHKAGQGFVRIISIECITSNNNQENS